MNFSTWIQIFLAFYWLLIYFFFNFDRHNNLGFKLIIEKKLRETGASVFIWIAESRSGEG